MNYPRRLIDYELGLKSPSSFFERLFYCKFHLRAFQKMTMYRDLHTAMQWL